MSINNPKNKSSEELENAKMKAEIERREEMTTCLDSTYMEKERNGEKISFSLLAAAYGDDEELHELEFLDAERGIKNGVKVNEYELSKNPNERGYHKYGGIINIAKGKGITKEAQELTKVHETHHVLNSSRKIYDSSKYGMWLGFEAFARINKADELGARISQFAHVREAYIKAGGGEKGLAEIEKYANSGHPLASMIKGYGDCIKEGIINPMSNDKNDFEIEMNLISNYADIDLKYGNYDKQYKSTSIFYATAYNIENIKLNEEEVQKRCDAAMTVPMTVNGELRDITFSRRVEIEPNEANKDYLKLFKTIDNNPELAVECLRNKEEFIKKTEQMQTVLQERKNRVAGNNNTHLSIASMQHETNQK